MPAGPRIYNLFPPLVGPIEAWRGHVPRIAAMGFDWIFLNPFHYPGFSGSLYAVKDYHRLNPLFGPEEGGDEALAGFVRYAGAHGIRVMMDLVINHTAKDALLAALHPEWYARNPDGSLKSPGAVDPDDPDKVTEWGDLAELDYENAENRGAMAAHWGEVVAHYAGLGFAGFRCDAAYKVPAEVWAPIIGGARARFSDLHFAAETLGCKSEEVAQLASAGFDFLFNSAKWWDFRAPWLLEQYEWMRRIAPSIAFPESHDTPRLCAEVPEGADAEALYRLRAAFSAFFSAGWMMPVGYEYGFAKPLDVVETRPSDWEEPRFDLSAFVADLNRVKAGTPALNDEGPQRLLSGAGSPVVVLLRSAPDGEAAALLAANVDPRRAHAADPAALLEGAGLDPARFEAALGASEGLLPPLGVALWRTRQEDMPAEREASGILVLDLQPSVDCGRFPVKREVGDTLEVTADLIKEGHDRIAARILWRERGEAGWRAEPMVHQDNDRWIGRVRLERATRCQFTVEAWPDRYETWRSDLAKKRGAGQEFAVELAEGRALLEAARWRARDADRERLERVLAELGRPGTDDGRADLMSSPLVQGVMARWPDRSRATRHSPPRDVVVDPPRARFAAWYGMVARSQGSEPGRASTFKDCERRLPDIARMGFDVLYLLPIHPIGRVHRKGPNNTLVAGEGDPGSPYAIGSEEGGHDAIHPELGTLEDFRRLVAAARRLGMEVALDFAIQCAPDHPWVAAHPEWFVWRPDGTIKYAENPPKKYQDIVNVDFHGPAAPALWRELLRVTLFWVAQGVTAFRVDNPHTKPIPFWEWLIGKVRQAHPEVVFLSEAFTRPKLMKALAKAGFGQSYTYFTWRTFKREIEDYLSELATGESREYLRPNLWPVTPDILPRYLQTGGRAAFRIRLALAATLSSVYGIPNGYELCENDPVPGTEEYRDSEKYQIRVRDWDAEGNIKDEIARINAIRRENPALHEFENLRFHPSGDESVVFYGKATPDRSNMIFVAVTLDPFDARDAVLELPLEEMGVAPADTFEVEELLTGTRHLWRGARHKVRLDPHTNPSAIYRVTVWTSVDYRSPCL